MTAVASPLQSDQPMRVLNDGLARRLASVNEAIRALQGAGYRVVRQDLRLGTAKPPMLHLARGDELLRKQLTQIQTGINDDGAYVLGRFMDVDLCWATAKPQLAPQRATVAKLKPIAPQVYGATSGDGT